MDFYDSGVRTLPTFFLKIVVTWNISIYQALPFKHHTTDFRSKRERERESMCEYALLLFFKRGEEGKVGPLLLLS